MSSNFDSRVPANLTQQHRLRMQRFEPGPAGNMPSFEPDWFEVAAHPAQPTRPAPSGDAPDHA